MLTNSSLFPLRRLLLLDATTCAAMGLVLIPAADLLAALTAIPAALLLWAGVVLLPTAVFMAVVATRALGFRPAVWAVVAGNLLWVVVSLSLLVSGWIAPNALGQAFITAQAAAVGLFAALEYLAMRRESNLAMA